MKQKNKYPLIIAVLSVLLAITLCALAVVLYRNFHERRTDSDSSYGNIIVPIGAVSMPGYRSALSLRTPAPFLGVTSPDTKIKLTEKGKETAAPFLVTDMLPGDHASKTFTVKVGDKSAKSLAFSAVLTSGSVPGDKFTMTVKAGNTVLYQGKLGNVEDKLYSVNGICDVDYEITVELDTSAGNEYADLKVVMKFVWSFEYEEYDPVTVTYVDGVSGAAFAPQETELKRGDPTPSFVGEPSREGFIFKGWYPNVSSTATDSMTYTAQWAVEVTFNVDGKTQTVCVPEKDTVNKPATPHKAGCGFAGWYLDQNYTEKFDFDTPLTAATTLYARFFLYGDVDCNGRITAADADLIGLYVMEIDNPNIKNIMAGRVSALTGYATANDANNIVRYVMEAIDNFPVESLAKGYEYDLENQKIIPPED